MPDSILRRAGVATAALAAALVVASCTTATPYQPATGSGQYRTGYWDQQIENDRFRVTFAGNTLTGRETVERYLLYRAAELTLQNGDDHFILVDRETETRTSTSVSPSFGRSSFGGPYGYWRPYWRWYRPSYGWRSWNPFWDDPFERDFDVRTVQRFEASAEVKTGKGPRPNDNIRAFDAREVLARLGPSIQMPGAK